MKKMKQYILAALAVMGFAGQADAQRDITSQYITNATLSNGTTGWTVSNFNTPQQGNNTVGYASEAYAGWSSLETTSYSLTQNITLPKGSYRLVNYSFFRQGLLYNTDSSKSLAYLKAGSQQVAIKTLGSITAPGYANTQAEGANCFDSKMYRNVVEFETDADNTIIEIGIVGTFDLKQSWCIAGMFELFDLNDEASVSSPTDVTYTITNPGFEYRDLTGWTADKIAYQDNEWGKKVGKGFAEAWQWNAGLSAGSITQVITGLPNGLYELSVYAHNINQRNGDAPCTGMFVTANNSQTEIGAYGQYKVRSTITDGNLTIGVKLQNCTGNWVAFDRFELSFYGDPETALRDLIDAYTSEAEGLLAGADASYLTDSEKSALQQAIANAKSATSDNLSERLEALISTLESTRTQIETVKQNRVLMIAALERFENDYNLADGTDYSRQTMSAGAWTELLAKVNAVSTALDNVSQATNYGTIKDALVSQMDATDTSLRLFKSYKAMVEGTTALGIAGNYGADDNMDSDATEQTAIAALNTAFGNYAATQTDDFSAAGFLGDNLDFNAAHGTMIAGKGNGVDSGNYGIFDIAGWDELYQDYDNNYYIQTANSSYQGQLYIRSNWDSGNPTLEVQKKRMLPTGHYRLSLKWKSDLKNMENHSTFVVGTTSTTIGEASDDYKTLTYEFEVTDSPQPFDLTLGFKRTATGNAAAQILVDDITLTYLQTALALNDAEDNSSTITNKNGRTFDVTLQGRTLYKDGSWNTLCLPFNTGLTGDLAGATLMELDTATGDYDHQTGLDGTTLYLNFKNATTIAAHTPYIIKWSDSNEPIVNPVFNDVTLVDGSPAAVASSDGKVTFKGTYAPIVYADKDVSVLLMGAGNTLYYPNGVAQSSINAFRAYFKLASGANARSFVLNFGGDASGIQNLSSDASRLAHCSSLNDGWYTLDGRRLNVQPTKAGVYINHGNKVVIK